MEVAELQEPKQLGRYTGYVTKCTTDEFWIDFRAGEKDIFLLQSAHTGSGTHESSHSVGCRGHVPKP